MKSFNEYNHEQHAYDKQRKLKENKTERKNQKQHLKNLVDNRYEDYLDEEDLDSQFDD